MCQGICLHVRFLNINDLALSFGFKVESSVQCNTASLGGIQEGSNVLSQEEVNTAMISWMLNSNRR